MNISKFQLAVLGVFGFFIIISVIIFSQYKGAGSEKADVTIWGSIPRGQFAAIIQATPLYQSEQYNISYEEKSVETFDSEFVEALAAGGGPDLIILPHDKIVSQRNKLLPIPYETLSEREYKESFIEGSEIYLHPSGILGLPIAVDPLVMYWNRSIFNDARITIPPKYWDEFYTMAPQVSMKDGALNIIRSFVSFGEYRNIYNAKAILSTLMMQAGTPIVSMLDNGSLRSVMTSSFNQPGVPAEAAVNFYTEFSNPVKQYYSWNRSLPRSDNYFLSGDLALYLGFSSELTSIQLKNPNLNFDITSVPSSREGGVDTVFGKFYALSIARGSGNPSAALAVAYTLAGRDSSRAIAEILGLPPVRRDLLGERQTSAYKSVMYESAIRSRAWLDPNPQETDEIFATMIESVTSGRERTSGAVSKTHRELENLLR